MSKTKEYEVVGRSATFTMEIASQNDIEDLADRIVQPVGIGLRRDELDGVSVGIQEKTSDGGDGLQTTFQSIVDDEADVEAVAQRVVNVLFMGFRRGIINQVKVNIVELEESDLPDE